MKNFIIPSLLFLAIVSLGCSHSSHFVQDGSQIYPETDPSAIEIFAGDVDRDYVVIGTVASDVGGDGSKASKRAKLEASKMGADAIIFIKLTKINSFAQRTGLSGVAIKYTD